MDMPAGGVLVGIFQAAVGCIVIADVGIAARSNRQRGIQTDDTLRGDGLEVPASGILVSVAQVSVALAEIADARVAERVHGDGSVPAGHPGGIQGIGIPARRPLARIFEIPVISIVIADMSATVRLERQRWITANRKTRIDNLLHPTVPVAAGIVQVLSAISNVGITLLIQAQAVVGVTHK